MRTHSIDHLVRTGLREYPTNYGKSPLRVFDQLFFTNGNGMEWHRGGLRNRGRSRRMFGDKRTKRVWPKVWEYLKRIARGETPVPPPSPNAEALEGSDFMAFIDVEIIAKCLCRPLSYYSISLAEFSLVCDVPNNVRKDYLPAIRRILEFAFLHPEGDRFMRESSRNALVHLLRLKRRFPAYFASPLELDKMLMAHEQRKLELSRKCSLREGGEDDTKLTLAEFFEHRNLAPDGLTKSQMELVRECYPKFKVKSAKGKAD